MRLGQKNFVYSIVLTGVMLLFLLGYFIYMLPSLYVDYVMEQNLKSLLEQHRSYVENGTYEGIRLKNSTACFSVEAPLEGSGIRISGKFFSAEITVQDERLRELLAVCQQKWKETDVLPETEGSLNFEHELNELQEILQEYAPTDIDWPLNVRLLYTKDTEGFFYNEAVKVHTYNDGVTVIESSIEEASGIKYVNYIAVEQTDESLIFSVLPVVAPEADEIRPVVLQSLPMLGAVIVLIVLLFSGIYSRGIVNPIVKLVQHAGQMKYAEDFSVKRLYENTVEKKDEVRELADTLDDFYGQIKKSYRELAEKNEELEEKNRRQEVFLRASSHQLKTPVAAALLLVEGMMNEIGKYKDTKAYLPRVKEQLLSMRKMVEDILYLNRCSTENVRFQKVETGAILSERIQSCQVAIDEKRLVVEFRGEESLTVSTDERMFTQILDNLLSNAVKYTPAEGRIRIGMFRRTGESEICIENFGVTIPEELLPHIYEPFVSGSHSEDSAGARSHGLGLYIASYYAKKLEISLSVRSEEDCVVSTLVFRNCL